MSTISITPDGFFVNDHDDEGNPTRELMHPGRVFTHLRSPCTIADGTTLGDIFYWVDVYCSLKEFIAQYSWCRSIDEFHAQAKLPRVDRDDGEIIDYIEIYHGVYPTRKVQKITHPGGHRERLRTVDYTSYPDIHGVGVVQFDNEDCGRKAGETITWSIEFSPMNEIAHLPVKLNEEFIVKEPFDAERHKYQIMRETLIEDERSFTFLEVLDAIYWEISFHGSPCDSANVLESLRDQVAEIKSGTAKTIPLKDLLDKLSGTEDKE